MPKAKKSKHTVIVTGGAGFIGSHVVDRLVDEGHQVHVIDDLSTGERKFVHPNAKLHVMDIRSSRLTSTFRRIRPDRVIHLAAHIDLRTSIERPRHDAAINLDGGLSVLEAALASGAKHLTFASTAAVYSGKGVCPAPEEVVCTPQSPYGIAKHAFEHYLRFAQDVHGLRTASLRFSNVYGPRQTTKGEAGVVAIFGEQLLSGKRPKVFGDGKQTRDFIYVGDVAQAVCRASSRRVSGVFNVSTGKETTVNSLFALLSKALEADVSPKRAKAVPGEERRSCLDPRKAKRVFAWVAKTSLKDGLAETAEWLKVSKGAKHPVR